MCSAGSRLLVQESVREPLLAEISRIAPRHGARDPLDPHTTLGAMVDETQTHRVMDYIAAGRSEGARAGAGR